MILRRKIWMQEYFSNIRSNIFVIVQICLALFLINQQVSYIALRTAQLNSITETDNDTYLYQYSMAAAGLFDIENGDYNKACEKIRALDGIENIGEIFDTSISIDGDSEKYPDDWFQLNIMDSLVTSSVTYKMEEGRWLNESDRDGTIVHAVLGGALAKRHNIGDIMNITLDTGKTYEIKVIGKLAEHCKKFNLHVLMADQNMDSFMIESENDVFVNHEEILEEEKNKDITHSAAHCIVKLNQNADKKFLSDYGKLVSFQEMLQETKETLNDFIKYAAVEGIVWTVVIIFGIIATSYLIGKKRRYVWGIYLMLGEKPKRLLKIYMLSNGITYIIGISITLLIYKIYYRSEGMSFMTDIGIYHIVTDLAFLIIMMLISLISNLYILKMEPKEIVIQTKE